MNDFQSILTNLAVHLKSQGFHSADFNDTAQIHEELNEAISDYLNDFLNLQERVYDELRYLEINS